jgi:translation initiation factor IF-1
MSQRTGWLPALLLPWLDFLLRKPGQPGAAFPTNSAVREWSNQFFRYRRMKEEHIEVQGSIQTVLPGTMFRVELDNKHLVLATICGKMRKRWVRLTVGDRVKMEMSPYDLNKARITWRLK